MQSFLERLIFPRLTYTDPPGSLFPKKIPACFIYTMNITEDMMKEWGYAPRFAGMEQLLSIIFGSARTLLCFDTYQFKDYSKYVAPRFNAEEKLKRRKEIFPQDCQKAFEMGVKFVRG